MELKRKKEQLGSLQDKIQKFADDARAEKRDFTTEERSNFEQLKQDILNVKKDIEILEMIEQESQRDAVPVPDAKQEPKQSREQIVIATDRAWKRFLRGSMNKNNLTEEERKLIFANELPEYQMRAAQQSVSADGVLIPEGYYKTLTQAMLPYGDVYNLATVIKTDSGNDLPMPITNDTSNVAYQINEATDAETSATAVTFSTGLTMKAYKWTSGLVRVSQELLEDSAFSMIDLLQRLFAERMGRGLNAAYTTGVGTTTIEGVTVGATDSSVSASASTITRDNLLYLKHSVNALYRKNGTFMMNDTTLRTILSLAFGTSDDRPLYQLGDPTKGMPDMIEGSPFVVNDDMASIGAGLISILYGDFKNYFIREVNGIRIKVLNELFAASDEIGFVMFGRYDGQVMDAGTHPLKYIKHATT